MERKSMSLWRTAYLVSVIFLVWVSVAQATDYYVSPSGNAAWSSCSNINTPCAPATAMANAVAGDTVYFRGGTYKLSYDLVNHSDTFYWYNGALNPAHSGTSGSPIVFMAYPGELPILDVATVSGNDNAKALGLNSNSYITFDGFKCIADGGAKMGGISIMGNDAQSNPVGIIVRNCIIDGGTTIITTTDNREPLRIEKVDNTIVENCIIYNARQVNEWHNTSALKMYDNNYLTIRNNEIYNTSNGIYLKRNNNHVNVYNNYVHDNYMGGFVAIYLTNQSSNISLYNNVFSNNSYSSFGIDSDETTSRSNDFIAYNNTFYNSPNALSSGYTDSGHGAVVFNNIFYSIASNTFTSKRDISLLKEFDHNNLGSSFKVTTNIYGSSDVYTSLSSWQSSSELESGGSPGSGSLASNPGFTNGSGTMSQLDDFRLASNSPSKGAGRNGTDMGANIDLVGPGIVNSSIIVLPASHLTIQ